MINTILYATDLCAFGAYSLMHVESLSTQYDADVIVLHALPPIGNYASAMVKTHCTSDETHQLLDHDQAGLCSAMRETIYDGLLKEEGACLEFVKRVTDVIVDIGAPANVILSHAERLNVDLIVIGSHGVDAIDGAVLGSVASKVLQLSKTPVYMVPMVDPVAFRNQSAHKTTQNPRRDSA